MSPLSHSNIQKPNKNGHSIMNNNTLNGVCGHINNTIFFLKIHFVFNLYSSFKYETGLE